MARFTAFWSRLRDDQRGTALIEGGFAFILIAFLIMGTTDIARSVAVQQRLEEVASRALERAIAEGNANSDYADVRQDAATAAGVPLASVTIDRWLECNGTRQTSYTTVCTAGQQYARFLSIRIVGSYQPMFDFGMTSRLYGNSGLNGVVTISGDAMVRVQ